MTSRKPRVVTIAARGRRRVISALVATVVPWRTERPRQIHAGLLDPFSTPSIGSAVDGTLATSSSTGSGSSRHTSVNVPPTRRR